MFWFNFIENYSCIPMSPSENMFISIQGTPNAIMKHWDNVQVLFIIEFYLVIMIGENFVNNLVSILCAGRITLCGLVTP